MCVCENVLSSLHFQSKWSRKHSKRIIVLGKTFLGQLPGESGAKVCKSNFHFHHCQMAAQTMSLPSSKSDKGIRIVNRKGSLVARSEPAVRHKLFSVAEILIACRNYAKRDEIFTSARNLDCAVWWSPCIDNVSKTDGQGRAKSQHLAKRRCEQKSSQKAKQKLSHLLHHCFCERPSFKDISVRKSF